MGDITPTTPSIWKLETGDDETATMTTGEGSIGIHVANQMSVFGEFKPDGRIATDGPVTSTRMMPPPHLSELEQRMHQLLGTMSDWELENGHLVVNSPVVGGTLWTFQRTK
eukprot:Blabericola_migrator_1__10211@NODE_5709_length_693_cov_735_961661_g3732_i0_p1_GENE_NODE_5709_length_693_cov_735_961661_g3732_i0NODE_5709_length_693_cov_735_961661_g3732_i0_p1_ORF_typecomplete_len111_score12_49META/PF03724_16/3_3e08_NODE_5709_length_693_cov_735_961661_g3732_i0142474